MKRVLSILLTLVMILAASAMAEGEKKDIVVGGILSDLTNEFYLQMVEAGNAAAEDYGITVIWQSCDSNIEKQTSLVENFILQGVDCIALEALNDEAGYNVCKLAGEAGIPIITMAAPVAFEGSYSTLYPDRQNLRIATEAICYAIGGEGKVGLLSGDSGNWVINEREMGFKEAIEEFPNVEGDIQLTRYDVAQATSITENWITTGGVDGVVAVSDVYVLAGMAAAQNQGVTSIYWGGNDGNISNMEIMGSTEGTQIVDHLTGGFRVGYWNIATAARICLGEEIPTSIYLYCPTVMSDETAAMLQEKGFTCDYVTVERANEMATIDAVREIYGPQVSTEDFIG